MTAHRRFDRNFTRRTGRVADGCDVQVDAMDRQSWLPIHRALNQSALDEKAMPVLWQADACPRRGLQRCTMMRTCASSIGAYATIAAPFPTL
jgi:hypothetical protein